MWGLAALSDALGRHEGLVVSVSSLLIMLVFQPFAKNAILMGRSISDTVLTLLAGHDGNSGGGDVDGGVVLVPAGTRGVRRRHCERCAARRPGGEEQDDGLPLSGSDVAAIMASLGLVVAGRQGLAEAADDLQLDVDGLLCGGCEAMAVVEEMAESKAAEEGELRDAFGVFDRDGDGFVSAGELWRVLRRLGMREGARYEDCARMVDARDADGDGRLSFPEFRAMMEDAA